MSVGGYMSFKPSHNNIPNVVLPIPETRAPLPAQPAKSKGTEAYKSYCKADADYSLLRPRVSPTTTIIKELIQKLNIEMIGL